MSIQEFCIIPKQIVDRLSLPSKSTLNDTSDKIKILEKKTSVYPNENNKLDLSLEISKLFTSKNKIKKALNVYSWMINNVPDIEISSNGQLIKPLKQINIFDFFRDIYSTNKHFSKDKLEIYKIFIAWTDLPNEFIDNVKIKNYVFSEVKNNISRINPIKRKLPFPNIRNPKIKKTNTDTDDGSNVDNNEDYDGADDDLNEGESSPVTISEFNKLIKDVKSSPYLTERQRSKLRSSKKRKGFGNIFHANKYPSLSLKWINY